MKDDPNETSRTSFRMSRRELSSREIKDIGLFCLGDTPSQRERKHNSGKVIRKSDGKTPFTKRAPDVGSEACKILEKSQSKRQYKVLTFKDGLGKDKLGIDYHDVITGQLLFHAPTVERVVYNNVITYDTKEAAISEQGGKTGMPRVMGIFECWGKVYKRKVGPPSHMYEFVRCMKVGEQLDKVATLQATCHFEEGQKGRKHVSPEEIRLQRIKPMLKDTSKYTHEDFTDGTVEVANYSRSEAMWVAQRKLKICLPGVEMADDSQYKPPQIKLPARKPTSMGMFYESDDTKRVPGFKRNVLFPGGSPTKPPPHLKNMESLIKRSLA